MNQTVLNPIIQQITGREVNLFGNDLEGNKNRISQCIEGHSVLVTGGGGSIGLAFIKALLPFRPRRLFVADLSENGLAELVRDLRSSGIPHLPELRTYAVNYGGDIFARLIQDEGPFEIVANFAAHKHVRSGKDEYAIRAMLENNFLNVYRLMELMKEVRPAFFFSISTDKASRPASMMGATKQLMERLIFTYQDFFPVTSARLANVAFSQGSLPDSWIQRVDKQQTLVCPSDVNRFFVSAEEAGTLSLLACLLGESGELFFPRLEPQKDLVSFSRVLVAFLQGIGMEPDYCPSEEEARRKILEWNSNKSRSYPVIMVPSDTSGEKEAEEFYSPEDVVDWKKFEAIGVVRRAAKELTPLSDVISEANELMQGSYGTSDFVRFFNKYLPDFNYLDRGKSLDEKM